MIDALPAQPVIDVRSAADLAGTSEEAARQALNTLESRSVIKQVIKRNWGRVWEAQGVRTLIDRCEPGVGYVGRAPREAR